MYVLGKKIRNSEYGLVKERSCQTEFISLLGRVMDLRIRGKKWMLFTFNFARLLPYSLWCFQKQAQKRRSIWNYCEMDEWLKMNFQEKSAISWPLERISLDGSHKGLSWIQFYSIFSLVAYTVDCRIHNLTQRILLASGHKVTWTNWRHSLKTIRWNVVETSAEGHRQEEETI